MDGESVARFLGASFDRSTMLSSRHVDYSLTAWSMLAVLYESDISPCSLTYYIKVIVP